jgi:nitroimidazol reductase NimA-like FMN-containing flavoprotein (pyridoxamine 5'-phosphate oxidase superfamily)
MNIDDPEVRRRLKSEQNIWVATVRPDGRPHLTPAWFALHAGKVYVCIDPDSVKAHNLARNRQVALALEDGAAPLIVEGETRLIEGAERPPGALDEFKRKYDWDIAAESQYSLLVEVTPKKVLSWGGGE